MSIFGEEAPIHRRQQQRQTRSHRKQTKSILTFSNNEQNSSIPLFLRYTITEINTHTHRMVLTFIPNKHSPPPPKYNPRLSPVLLKYNYKHTEHTHTHTHTQAINCNRIDEMNMKPPAIASTHTRQQQKNQPFCYGSPRYTYTEIDIFLDTTAADSVDANNKQPQQQLPHPILHGI